MPNRFLSEERLSREFKDFAISFNVNPNTQDFSITKNNNAIKQSLRNLILTDFGERPFQQEIGSRVRELMFDQFDVFLAEDLRDEIRNVITNLEPRVELINVSVREGRYQTVIVELEYTIIGQNLVQTAELILERT